MENIVIPNVFAFHFIHWLINKKGTNFTSLLSILFPGKLEVTLLGCEDLLKPTLNSNQETSPDNGPAPAESGQCLSVHSTHLYCTSKYKRNFV